MVSDYDIGEAAVILSQTKIAADSSLSYSMKGRLTFSSSGWVILEVPNALGNGAFQALNELGIEQPVSGSLGRYNAHISVIRPEEVEQIGGPDMLAQYRGQMFSYTIGSVREIQNPAGWPEVAKIWVLEVKSPELLKLRRSFNLGEPKYPFHITFAIRKRNILRKTAALLTLYKQAASQTEIKDSPIHGKGLFATTDFKDGDVIVPHLMTRYHDDDGRTRWEQSEQARFTNHNHDPNTFVRVSEAVTELVASKPIKRNEELTADYVAVTKTLGPNFYFTYKGKPYNGETDSDNLSEFLASDSIRYADEQYRKGNDTVSATGAENLLRDTKVCNESSVGGMGEKYAERFQAATVLSDEFGGAVCGSRNNSRSGASYSRSNDKFASADGRNRSVHTHPASDSGNDWEKVAESLRQRVATARRQTQEPKSEAQAVAGNYPKGRVRMHGFDIVIETGKGQTRSGTDANGKKWSVTMAFDYGDIKRTTGKDGDALDVFIGEHPDTELVFVVDQLNENGKFDEHKVMMGFRTFEDAKSGYLANYETGWESRIGNITPLTLPQFRWWVNNGPMDKPCAGQKQIKLAMDSYYARALNATPLNWKQQQSVVTNLLQHMQAVKARGDRFIGDAYAYDRLQNAMNPDRANAQLLARIQGTQPAIVNHPVDKLIQGDYTI